MQKKKMYHPSPFHPPCGMAERLRWAMPAIAGGGVAGMQCKYMAAVPGVPPGLANMEVRLVRDVTLSKIEGRCYKSGIWEIEKS